jgi:nucleoside-diphosphate-sugar epimerase
MERNINMKILILGNMGYVGPWVVSQLRSSYKDATIIGFDMGYFAANLINTGYFPECGVDIQYIGDVRNMSHEIVGDVDAIVYLAAISNDPMSNKYERVTGDINHIACIEIAKKAKQAGVKSFVFASSCSVYGFAEEGARNESSELNPLTPYAKSKVNSERDLMNLASDSFKITCPRFATACGTSPRLRLDLVLNDFVASAVINKKILILSDGTPWRPLINTKDMARAIQWAIERPLSKGGPYLIINVGSNEWNYQVEDLAKEVARVIPNVDISINKDAQPDKRSYKVDFSLFEEMAPQYQPLETLNSTIIDLYNIIGKLHFSNTDFRQSPVFIRLKTLESLRERGFLTENLMWTFKTHS